jgi:hypothetical protein
VLCVNPRGEFGADVAISEGGRDSWRHDGS